MVRTLDASKTSLAAEKLKDAFSKLIVRQDKAVNALIGLVEKYKAKMYDRTKPIGSVLELGPTGTGKTAVGEAFVTGLGGDPQRNLMRIDCTEFQHSHEIAKLLGSPPGYLGHRETHPFFTNASVEDARKDKNNRQIMDFTVIQWDEIEKASDALWALLLGILDKATLTTGTNEKINFGDTVHILTSNVGAAEMQDEGLGFGQIVKQDVTDRKLENIAMEAARKKFLPEFLNRMDYVVMFNTLREEDLTPILDMQLNLLQDRILLNAPVTFEINVSPAGVIQLTKEGFDKRYGARELKRVLEKHVALPLSRMVASDQIQQNDTVIVDYKNDTWQYFAVTEIPKIGASNGA